MLKVVDCGAMGRGVIARHDIPPNTVVAEYRGTLVSREEGNELDKERQDRPMSYQMFFPLLDTSSRSRDYKREYYW